MKGRHRIWAGIVFVMVAVCFVPQVSSACFHTYYRPYTGPCSSVCIPDCESECQSVCGYGCTDVGGDYNGYDCSCWALCTS
jgi:hypothetical protein